MKLIVISFLLSICSFLLNSAELKFEAYGYSSSEILNISDQHIFYHYSDRFIFTTNAGISGEGNCKGIVEIVNGQQSSNLVCKSRDENGDTNHTQFKAIANYDSSTQGTQTFTYLAGEGRWKELVGQKCIGASSNINSKIVGNETYEETYMFAGKCNIPDASLERFINYKKPE